MSVMRKELLTFAEIFSIGRERRTIRLVTEEEEEEKNERTCRCMWVSDEKEICLFYQR